MGIQEQIQVRYGKLAEESCCLSCGSAVKYAEPAVGEVCVDLGSGRGTDAIRMAEQVGDTGMVYGIDISEGMLAKARKTAQVLGVMNCEFRQTDLAKLDLKCNSVDLIVSNCVLNHAPDKQAVWNEIFRVLKPGGRFAISDIYSTVPVPEKYRNDPEAVAECWAGSDTKANYLATIGQAGFPEIEILEESAPYPKGEIEVCSFTLAGRKPSTVKSCCSR
jgi:ubiquinone/menaquinone biosynthesis C-methylase UbiE